MSFVVRSLSGAFIFSEPDQFFDGQSIGNGLFALPVGFVDQPLIVVDVVESGGKLC